MKQLIKVVLPFAVLGLLGGCGSQTKSHSDAAKTKTAKVTKKTAHHVSSTSNAVSGKQASSAETSARSQKASQPAEKRAASTQQQAKASQAKANSNKEPKTAVTKAAHPAVTQQSVASRISQSLSGQYKPQDLAFQFSQSGSGTYTVQVQENHQSPNMQAKGADPSTSPTIAWFKTNASGQLLKSVDGGVNYSVVGNAY